MQKSDDVSCFVGIILVDGRKNKRKNINGVGCVKWIPVERRKSNSNLRILYLIEIDDRVTLFPEIQVNLVNKDQTELCDLLFSQRKERERESKDEDGRNHPVLSNFWSSLCSHSRCIYCISRSIATHTIQYIPPPPADHSSSPSSPFSFSLLSLSISFSILFLFNLHRFSAQNVSQEFQASSLQSSHSSFTFKNRASFFFPHHYSLC